MFYQVSLRKFRNHALLVLFSMIALYGQCQADPSWLKSWEEANTNRPASITSSSRIAPADEPGIPFMITGEIYAPDGSLAQDVIVHAYHRDKDGFDFGPGDRSLTTWRLQGWAKTDSNGRFRFQTIRPAPDHLGREGAHIHFTVVSPDWGRQWAPTTYFSDDPQVTDSQREKSSKAGNFGFVRHVSEEGGVQSIEVKIRLKAREDF